MVDVQAQAEELLRKIRDGFAKSKTDELRLKIENKKITVLAAEIHEVK